MAFRKGKKAFKAGVKNKLFNRYLIFLAKQEAKRKAAIRTAKAALTVAMSMMQIRQIRSQAIPKYDNNFKTRQFLSLAEVSINTANSIAEIMNEA